MKILKNFLLSIVVFLTSSFLLITIILPIFLPASNGMDFSDVPYYLISLLVSFLVAIFFFLQRHWNQTVNDKAVNDKNVSSHPSIYLLKAKILIFSIIIWILALRLSFFMLSVIAPFYIMPLAFVSPIILGASIFIYYRTYKLLWGKYLRQYPDVPFTYKPAHIFLPISIILVMLLF